MDTTFTKQIQFHRAIASQQESARSSYNSRSSWFPQAQRNEYSHLCTVYADCLQKYGEDHFELYAIRNRLHKIYPETDTLTEVPMEESTEISMNHLAGYKIPKTTNGEYGSIRPSQLFFC